MLQELKELLCCLNETLDPERFAEIELLHQSALKWQEVPRLPLIVSYPYPEDAKFQPFPHGQVFDDPEKMLFNQLVNAFDSSLYLSSRVGDDLTASIRADFGCVLISSMFGANVEQVENNPPWIRHGENEISYSQIIHTDPSDFSRGWIPRVVSRYKFYHDIISDYSNLSNILNITLPDLQGPFDNLELIRGSNIFLDMYSEKDCFLNAMDAVTKIQIALAGYLNEFTDEKSPGFTHQHNFPLKGGILLRNDTSIMVSPEMYNEMIRPFDKMILDELGGGIHSCGDVGKIASVFLSIESSDCFDFGQSELNNAEAIYDLAKENKVALTRVTVSEQDLTDRKILEKYPTGASLIFRAKSFEHAKKVVAGYNRTCFRIPD